MASVCGPGVTTRMHGAVMLRLKVRNCARTPRAAITQARRRLDRLLALCDEHDRFMKS